MCINCLGAGYPSSVCTSKYKCQPCNRNHNFILHFNSNSTLSPVLESIYSSTSGSGSSSSQNTILLIVRWQPQQVVLLAITLVDDHRKIYLCSNAYTISFIHDHHYIRHPTSILVRGKYIHCVLQWLHHFESKYLLFIQ